MSYAVDAAAMKKLLPLFDSFPNKLPRSFENLCSALRYCTEYLYRDMWWTISRRMQ